MALICALIRPSETGCFEQRLQLTELRLENILGGYHEPATVMVYFQSFNRGSEKVVKALY